MIEDSIAAPVTLPPPLALGDFLQAFFQALASEGVRPCILRNYEGLPDDNFGNDIDFLVPEAQLPSAVRALRSAPGIRITGFTDPNYAVKSIFLDGVIVPGKNRALQVDFYFRLGWKGLPYLSTEAVLETALLRTAGGLSFYVPSVVHEAIDSLFASLMVGGWLKEKYFLKVQQVFRDDRPGVTAALAPVFGAAACGRLVDAVVNGDRAQILACVGPLRSSLARRSLWSRPFASLAAVVRHYSSVILFHGSPRTLETVFLAAPDRRLQQSVVEKLMPLLHSIAKRTETGELRLNAAQKRSGAAAQAAGQRVSLSAMARLAGWLVTRWRAQLAWKKNLTLLVCAGTAEDVLTDIPAGTGTHGTRVPAWFARLAMKLLPRGDLGLWLRQETNELKPGGGQAGAQGDVGRRTAPVEPYRSLMRSCKAHRVVDAGGPEDTVVEEVYAAIIAALEARTARKIERRSRS